MGAQDGYKATQDFWDTYNNNPQNLAAAWNKINPHLAGGTSPSGTGLAYDQVTGISRTSPGDMHELVDQYNKVGEAYSTSDYDQANLGQQSRMLTTALNAGNAAATEYANRARQSGGSALGAGLMKAQAAVGARKSAGELELKRQEFDASQRKEAAGLASQIATTLGTLRESYLKTLLGYAAQEHATDATLRSNELNLQMEQKKLDESSRQFNFTRPTSGGYETDRMGNINSLFGTPFRDASGLPTSNIAFAPTNRNVMGFGGG
jgi:hypothetical protein